MDVGAVLLDLLPTVIVEPRRLLLDTREVRATTSMLRGVWGRALRRLDRAAYNRVFEGHTGQAELRMPRYILRPAPPDPATAPAVEFIVLGNQQALDPVLMRAWSIAESMGLGKDRVPFRIREVFWMDSAGDLTSKRQHWTLDSTLDAVSGRNAGEIPVRLRFTAPLRILRKGKQILQPTITDVAVSLTRRLLALGSPSHDPRSVVRAAVNAARQLPSTPWRGERTDYVRWSGSQHREVSMRGVSGTLDLPAGMGDLWPLLGVGQWIHAGKGTVFGLGQMEVDVLTD